MASGNAPKHDFNPHWLKIPHENARPVGSRNLLTQDHGRQRPDDVYYNHFNGREYPRQLSRQNSFEVSDGSRHFSSGHAGKFRHHSMEDSYMKSSLHNGQQQFRSQPSLPRQDMKYLQVTGNGYGSFCDSYHQDEGFSNYGSGGHISKRSQYAHDGRAEFRESRDSDRSHKDGDDKDKTFNDDFPSLNGTDEDRDVKTPKTTGSGGVWALADNPLRSKLDDNRDTKNSSSGSSQYRVMPVKVGNVHKNSRDGIRIGSNTREGSPLSAVKPRASREGQPQSPTHSMEILSTRMLRRKHVDKKSEFLKALRKEADTESGLQNCVENLSNSGLQNCVDNFSNSMQNGTACHSNSSLQNGTASHCNGGLQNGTEDVTDKDLQSGVCSNNQENDHMHNDEKKEAQQMMNGVVELQLDCDPETLTLIGSFHLQSPDGPPQRTFKRHFTEEEEITLLLSMGWDESAETEEITEDEKREFLKKRLMQQQQRNGRSLRLLTKSLSAEDPAPQQPAQNMDHNLSSSDTDSDDA